MNIKEKAENMEMLPICPFCKNEFQNDFSHGYMFLLFDLSANKRYVGYPCPSCAIKLKEGYDVDFPKNMPFMRD